MTRLGLLALLGAAACGTDGGSCPRDQPASCPSPTPSFSGEVSALIQTYCATCHDPAGQAADKPLQTYAQIFSRRSAVLNQLVQCAMPPPDFPMPTESERQAILGWLVCGAPDN